MTAFVDSTTVITAAFLNACALVVEAAGPIAIAAVVPASDTIAYYDSATTAASTPLTAFARTLIDDANAAAARATLGLGTAAVENVGYFATAAQGALADTAVQPANPAFTGTATFNTVDFVVRSDGQSGFGYSGAPWVGTANRRYVTIMGEGVGTSDGAGFLQFRSNSPDGTNVVGGLEFIDPNNTSGNLRVGYIASVITGATANNRGSYMSFATREDGSASASEVARFTSTGQLIIGGTISYTSSLYIGDATSGEQITLAAIGGIDSEAAIAMYAGAGGVYLVTDGVSCPGGHAFKVSSYYDVSQDSSDDIANSLFTVSPGGNPVVLYGSNAWATIGMNCSTTEATMCLAHDAGGGGLGYDSELRFKVVNPTAAPFVVGKASFFNSTDEVANITGGVNATSTAGYLAFSTQVSAGALAERMRIHDNGFLSLGAAPTIKNGGTRAYLTVTANPSGVIDPAGSTVAHFASIDGGSGSSLTVDSYGGLPALFFRRCGTSIGAPTAVQADEGLGSVGVRPYNGTSWETTSRASMNQVAAENWTNTTTGTYLTFTTTNTGTVTTTAKMKLYPQGALAVAPTAFAVPASGTVLTASNNAAAGTVLSGVVAYFAAADGTASTVQQDSAAASATTLFRRANTSLAAPSALAANDLIGAVSARGYGATAYSTSSRANISFYAGEAWTDAAHGTYITLSTTALTTTTLTEQMRIADNGNITFTSKIISYNGVACVGNGVPQLVAKSLLTAQTAAIGATTIYAVPASGAGLYRVSFVSTVTTTATTSAGLGGTATTGFKVIFTSPTDSVVKTSTPNSQNNHVTTAGNATTHTNSGVYLAYCKASTNLQYSYDYASVNAAEMNYELVIMVEYLGA